MDNMTYFTELDKRIATLQKLRELCPSFAAGIIGQTLFHEDLFFCASLNRCVHLADGFTVLLQQRNLSCVGAILRLQMDNCMRTYAAFIAKDQNAVVDCVIHGKKICDQVDTDGKRMTDAHLKKKLAIFSTSFPDVYDRASGYIHLSNMAFYETVVNIDNYTISWQIGHQLQERFNPLLLEAADAFIHFTKLHYKMLQAVVDSKHRYDAIHEDNDNSLERGS